MYQERISEELKSKQYLEDCDIVSHWVQRQSEDENILARWKEYFMELLEGHDNTIDKDEIKRNKILDDQETIS
ncbi:hypothetical protein ILUMI_08674 [Ignelater luminosus]|uniref:Uncharacterized protein n=1 Tax=Ignelater luminosus TaxID=2038154 RepID=A0A8K0D6G5_IGNLU|nr:hypothetical protein ILUMI_08674 [Ignelater luminosus]